VTGDPLTELPNDREDTVLEILRTRPPRGARWPLDPVPGFDTPLPHIYGPLNPDAVVDAVPLHAVANGEFRFDPR
jgi:hypothetical protein